MLLLFMVTLSKVIGTFYIHIASCWLGLLVLLGNSSTDSLIFASSLRDPADIVSSSIYLSPYYLGSANSCFLTDVEGVWQIVGVIASHVMTQHFLHRSGR